MPLAWGAARKGTAGRQNTEPSRESKSGRFRKRRRQSRRPHPHNPRGQRPICSSFSLVARRGRGATRSPPNEQRWPQSSPLYAYEVSFAIRSRRARVGTMYCTRAGQGTSTYATLRVRGRGGGAVRHRETFCNPSPSPNLQVVAFSSCDTGLPGGGSGDGHAIPLLPTPDHRCRVGMIGRMCKFRGGSGVWWFERARTRIGSEAL